jgi:hypothetical protein
MSMTWGFGLRNELSADDHRRLLCTLWDLSPKHAETGNCVRDVIRIGGAYLMYECEGGIYQRTPESVSVPIFEAIERFGRFVSWPNQLAGDFHEGVAELGVPFPIATPDGYVDSLRVELPVLGARTIQYVREQARWLALDESSELLPEHGLSTADAYSLNERVHLLGELAIESGLLTVYG